MTSDKASGQAVRMPRERLDLRAGVQELRSPPARPAIALVAGPA